MKCQGEKGGVCGEGVSGVLVSAEGGCLCPVQSPWWMAEEERKDETEGGDREGERMRTEEEQWGMIKGGENEIGEEEEEKERRGKEERKRGEEEHTCSGRSPPERLPPSQRRCSELRLRC
eukprot:1958024-Rhodomonas_salina.5